MWCPWCCLGYPNDRDFCSGCLSILESITGWPFLSEPVETPNRGSVLSASRGDFSVVRSGVVSFFASFETLIKLKMSSFPYWDPFYGQKIP